MVECLDEVAGSHGRKSAVAHPIIREVSVKCIREVSRETAIAILSRYYYDDKSGG